MSAEARLKELGVVLPALAKPVANYVPYRIVGNVLYLSGQGPRDENGNMLAGKLGAEISIEEGYRRVMDPEKRRNPPGATRSGRSTAWTTSSSCSAW